MTSETTPCQERPGRTECRPAASRPVRPCISSLVATLCTDTRLSRQTRGKNICGRMSLSREQLRERFVHKSTCLNGSTNEQRADFFPRMVHEKVEASLKDCRLVTGSDHLS
ncbi:hypothetical protein Bbelb_435440 [Branchiostoma belcheri]|nr:hypothetical protein Bbelb_435440 [Branchiostoma belcheri]